MRPPRPATAQPDPGVLQTRQEVLELGIDKYNQHCRSIVMRCEQEWKEVVPRMGRWIDFEGGYKTMDANYMESVWWVFKVSAMFLFAARAPH